MCKSVQVLFTMFMVSMVKFVTVLSVEPFSLNIVHINDFHAKYEPTEELGDPWNLHACSDTGGKCIGGYARIIYALKNLLKDAKNKNQLALYLDSGDNFRGSIWYSIGRWNVTADFLNMIPADASTLGNHEFEHGVPGLIPYLQHIRSPITVANIDVSQEPTLSSIKRSVILNKGGRKIGVIGVITHKTDVHQPDTGKVRFLDEAAAIMKEANKLKMQNINIIIVVSHVGYSKEKIIAKKTGSLVDVIVGGHSHTFLYNEGKESPGPMKPGGDYPTVVQHSSGKKVLIVQVGSFARYLGNLTVDFDDRGEIVSYSGAPIYLSAETPEDEEVIAKRLKWKKVVDKVGQTSFGSTLDGLNVSYCQYRECTGGNFYTNALLDKFLHMNCKENAMRSSNISFAIVPGSVLFASIPKGVITYKHIYDFAPYNGKLSVTELQGRHIKQLLENSVSESYNSATRTRQDSELFLQTSGLQITYDLKKHVNQRVISVKIRCHKCKTLIFNDLFPNKYYKVITTRYFAFRAHDSPIFKNYGRKYKEFSNEEEILTNYVKKYSPLNIRMENRIKFV